MGRLRMSKANCAVWSEEAGLVPESPPQKVLSSHKAAALYRRIKSIFSGSLHNIRCKWCLSAIVFFTAGVIILTTLPILPLGIMMGSQPEGPIGPQLDFRMRPCRTKLHFSPTPLPRIALASFTGSGNTFLRGSIEQITGIWTGSIVPDYQLYHGGFYGEVTANEKVILIKTHGFGKKSSKAGFKKAVLLIRKPQESVLAKWNQQKTRTHTGIAKGETYDTEEWKSFAPRAVTEWKELNEYWLAQNPEALHVVQFEELMANKKEELTKVLHFIGYTDIDEEILDCVVEKYEGVFKRRKYKLDFEPFTEEVKEQIEDARDSVKQALEEWKFAKSDAAEIDAQSDSFAA